jgi:hypothetical protein
MGSTFLSHIYLNGCGAGSTQKNSQPTFRPRAETAAFDPNLPPPNRSGRWPNTVRAAFKAIAKLVKTSAPDAARERFVRDEGPRASNHLTHSPLKIREFRLSRRDIVPTHPNGQASIAKTQQPVAPAHGCAISGRPVGQQGRKNFAHHSRSPKTASP